MRLRSTGLLATIIAASFSIAACNDKSNAAPPAPSASAAGSAASVSAAPSSAPAASVASAPANGKPTGPLNVILLSIDSLRADMPWAGYSRPIAPRLTEFEKKAVSYTRAYSVSSYTSMSLGGLLAGKIPSGLVRSGYFFGFYAPENTMFPELLQKAGVYTMGVHAHFYFNKAGMQQGFDKWDIVSGISADNTTDKNITSPQSLELAIKALSDEKLKTQRFFFWSHFLDPHDVYMKHDSVTPYGKTDRDKYDAEVQYTDEHIGKLVDFIQKQPWADRTVIIFTSDHGEAFGEHGMQRHGFEVWENLVRIPMFVLAPGATPRRIDVARSAIDLAPTVLELTGTPAEASFEGKSLVNEIYGATPEARDIVVDLPTTSDNDRRRALIHGKDKLICSGNDENCRLFELETDPNEEKPIARGDKFKTLSELYKAHAKTIKEEAPTKCKAGCLNGAYARKGH